MILQIEKNELDIKFLADAVIGILSEVAGLMALSIICLWDGIAGKFCLQHQEGFGTEQIYAFLIVFAYMLIVGYWIKMTIHYWKHYGV